jgi:branched-chain amino acid transport system permease protein
MARFQTPLLLIVGMVVLVGLASLIGSEQLAFTLTEMLIRMVVVIGLYLFVGNSGVMSFGHIGFMSIGAYATAWMTLPPEWKQVMLTGLPTAFQENTYPFPVAVLFSGFTAAGVALFLGIAIMRLSGLAASIATFAFLAIVFSVYSNWESVTGGTSSVIGIPTVVGPWIAVGFVCAAIGAAYVFQVSRFGLMLRASRDDEVAAQSSAVEIVRMRLVAFIASAFLVGVGGSLYAHFLGVLTTDAFYLALSFITLAMLVVGGLGSLTGAVVGTLAVTAIVEVLRALERGADVGPTHLALPRGSQEIGLGLALALVLIFRPAGLSGGRELKWPFKAKG